MNSLEIRETDLDLSCIDLSNPEGSTLDSQDRRAVRSVVFNQRGEVALLYVGKYEYHKLPGGGIDADEDHFTALKREIREEVGCEVEVKDRIGMAVEYRDRFRQKQTSYCYVSTVIAKNADQQSMTELEISQGFQLKWVLAENAPTLLDNDHPLNYEGLFIQKRDCEFLSMALQETR